MVYAEQFGIELPSYSGDYDDPNDGYQIEPAVAAEMPDWVPVSEPKPGDAMLVAMLGFQSHVAVYVEPNRMLHTIEKYDTRIERFDRPAWKRRLRGFYRHLSR